MISYGLFCLIDYLSFYLVMDKEMCEVGVIGICFKKLDKLIDNVRKKFLFFELFIIDLVQCFLIGFFINGNFDMYYVNFFLLVFLLIVDLISLLEFFFSVVIIFIWCFIFLEEDLDFFLYDGDQELYFLFIVERGFLFFLIELWDGKDDELDFLVFLLLKNIDFKIFFQFVNILLLILDDNDSQEINKLLNEIGSYQVGKGILKDVFNYDFY